MTHRELSRIRFSVALLLVAPLTTMIPACLPPAAQTVPGPESNKLVSATSGFVVVERPHGGGIAAVELPSLRESTVVPDPPGDASDRPNIHAISGPDDQGRIAYIEDHFFVPNDKHRRHSLKTIWVDGTHDTTLFTRPGDAMWATTGAGHGEIGKHIALSPTGGRVALLTGTSDVQMPMALFTVGTVEIWDVEKKTGSKTNMKAIDDGFAWFPDGKRLAYARFVDAKTVPPRAAGDVFSDRFDGWDKVPAVFIRDVDAGTESFLHVGAYPVVSSHGGMVIVYDLYGNYELVDVATGKAKSISPPGEVIALLEDSVVLEWGLPTAGTPLKYTDNNSPLSGPKEMVALKLARLDTGEFQTVVPTVDPRMVVSFGRVKSGYSK